MIPRALEAEIVRLHDTVYPTINLVCPSVAARSGPVYKTLRLVAFQSKHLLLGDIGMLRVIATIMVLLTAATASSESSEPARANDAVSTATTAAIRSEAALAISAGDPVVKWGPCPPIFTAAGCEIAVLHGDPARPNADVFLRVPGGYALPRHRHTSAERMILVSGKMQVRYKGTPAATLAAGHYAYGPAGLPHEGSCLSDQPCTLFIAFEGPVDAEAFAGSLD